MDSVTINYRGDEMDVDYYEDDFGDTALNGVLIGNVEVIEMLTPDQIEEITVIIDEMEK